MSTTTRLPASWNATHYLHQALILLAAGAAFLWTTWDSPVYRALLDGLPVLVIPPGIRISARLLPFVLPILLGLPLVFGRQRIFGVVWLTLMALLSALAVIEVSRLNWGAFLTGVAFRVESGPVPVGRTLAGLAVLLSGLLLTAQRSVRETLRDLAGRGVPLGQIAAARRRFIDLERVLVVVLFGAGLLLTIVALVSMTLTDTAPDPDRASWVPLLWTGLLLALVVAAFALGVWRRQTEGEEGPGG